MTEQQEHKHQRTALLASIGIHGVAFLLMFVIVAWRTPDPPYGSGEPGVEVNLGFSDEGSGETQPETPVGSGGTQEEEPQRTEPPQVQPQETKPVEEKLLTSEEDDSPPVVKTEEKKEKPKDTPKPQPEKVVEQPKKQPEVKQPEQPQAPKQVYNPNASKTDSNNKTSDGKAGTPGNHGDDNDKTGDKGNPQGNPKAGSLYGQAGNGGSGGGAGGSGGVAIAGFNGFEWGKLETPALPDEAFGVYEFIVIVDDQGDILDIKSVQRGLSLEAERKMKAAIQKLVFIPKGTNLPPRSEGKITFKVVAR